MLIGLIIAVFLLFPVKGDVYLYYNSAIQKPIFAVNIYGLKVFGGYFKKDDEYIYLHYGRDKAFAVKLTNAKDMKIRISDFIGFKLTGLFVNISAKITDATVYLAAFWKVITQSVFVFLQNFSPPNFYKADLELNKAERNEAFFSVRIVFNILAIIIALYKILSENVWRKSAKKKN